MSLQEIISNSGDSILKDVKYSKGKLFVLLEHDEMDNDVLLDITTSLIQVNLPIEDTAPYRTCFIEVIELDKNLNLNNGIYVPSKDFGSFMQEKRKSLNLAYGLRQTEDKLLFTINGSSNMLSCVIKNLDSIQCQLVG